MTTTEKALPRLKQRYREEIREALHTTTTIMSQIHRPS